MLQVNRSLLEVYCSRIPDQEQGVYSSWIDESYATEVEGQSSPRLEQQIDLQSCCITKKLQGTTCMRQLNGISSCDLIRMILESLVAPFLLYKAGLKKNPLTEIMLVPRYQPTFNFRVFVAVGSNAHNIRIRHLQQQRCLNESRCTRHRGPRKVHFVLLGWIQYLHSLRFILNNPSPPQIAPDSGTERLVDVVTYAAWAHLNRRNLSPNPSFSMATQLFCWDKRRGTFNEKAKTL